MELIIKDLIGIDSVAKDFIDKIGDNKIVSFNAEMGAGKTTFIKAICKVLGATDVATSPTFSIVNEYNTTENNTIYHFDFYRLEQPEEALDFGLYEYLDSGNYCFIEWPEMVGNLLPEDILEVSIKVNDNQERVVSF